MLGLSRRWFVLLLIAVCGAVSVIVPLAHSFFDHVDEDATTGVVAAATDSYVRHEATVPPPLPSSSRPTPQPDEFAFSPILSGTSNSRHHDIVEAAAPPEPFRPEAMLLRAFPSSVDNYSHPYSPEACRPGGTAVRLCNVTRVYREAARVFLNFTDRRLLFGSEHERCHAVAVRNLFILSVILEEAGYGKKWFVTHGTLLGAWRHGGMIPWDVDIDIALQKSSAFRMERWWWNEFPRETFLQTYHTDHHYRMQTGFKGANEINRMQDRYCSYVGFKFPKKGTETRPYHVGPQIDIIPLWGGKTRGRWLMNTFFNMSDLFPTKLACFEGVMLPVPNKPEVVLRGLYGDSWATPPDAQAINRSFIDGGRCRATTPMKDSFWALDFAMDREMQKQHPYRSSSPIVGGNNGSNASVEEAVTMARLYGRADPVKCHWYRKGQHMRCPKAPPL